MDSNICLWNEAGKRVLIENYSPFITIEMGQNAPKPVLHDT